MGRIVYSVTKRRNPATAQVKYYPIRVGSERLSTDDVIDYIGENSQVPRAAVPSAVHAILKTITNFVLNGHSVELPRLGIFSATIQEPQSDAESAEAYRLSKDAKIMVRFRPSSSLSQELTYGISYVSVSEAAAEGV